MKAVVVGSAHLDVLATVTGDDLAIDKIGRVSIDVGGTGANISINMRKLGAEVGMLTAMNDSAFSRIVQEFMTSHGVKMVVETFSGPDAVFSAHIDKEGEMMSAISSMPVGFVSFGDETVRDLLVDADCLVLDCNVSAHELDRLTGIANSMFIPVFVAAVSEEKSLRVEEVSGKIDCIFMNAKEAAYYRAHCLHDIGSYQDMATAMDTSLVITMGAEGAVFSNSKQTIHIPPPKVNNAINFLGAGDAFMAATIFSHIHDGRMMREAVLDGARMASDVARQPNCNTGIAGAVQNIIRDLEYRASRDALTGLVSRGWAQASAQHIVDAALDKGFPVSVIAIDIDHFKRINDTFGHDAGDKVLRKVAKIIQKNVRDTDIASRWGGEEFIVILADTEIHAAIAVAERIRSSVQHDMREQGVTVSCGVSVLKDTNNIDHILKRADEMLYAAKNAGRNRVVF
jgi:diguanylate cyclase (GGDEF)-like protein